MMSCFSCFSTQAKKAAKGSKSINGGKRPSSPHSVSNPESQVEDSNGNNITAQTFTFRELANATKNFHPECLVGKGGFGRVYKGTLGKTGQVVAVKQLDRNGLQGNKEFLVEVVMLSLLHHPNLVKLIGYCADGEQRLLVYEYMPLGSLEDHLLGNEQRQLNWHTRIKIALAAAKGLEYLHDKANPPVIYRDLKSSNILLDMDFNAKLSDFGLAKLGPMGENTHVSTRVMGTYGYCAPEYQRTGHLTIKSDIYSFGVVFLELITGRRAMDTTRPNDEQSLVTWAQPMMTNSNRYSELADPHLHEDYPTKGLNQVVAIAAMCVQEEETSRPMVSDVVTALSSLVDTATTLALVPSLQVNHDMLSSNGIQTNQDIVIERRRAVAEAIAWGSHHNARSQAAHS